MNKTDENTIASNQTNEESELNIIVVESRPTTIQEPILDWIEFLKEQNLIDLECETKAVATTKGENR